MRENIETKKTWVISANFVPKRNGKGPTDLEKSLRLLGFSDFWIFDHNSMTGSEGIEGNSGGYKLNPMGIFPKVIRTCLRKSPKLAKIISKIVRERRWLLFLTIPHNLRLFMYRDFLDQIDSDDFVFLVDSRDLVFQEDPRFIAKTLAQSDSVHFFDEGEFYFKTGHSQLLKHSETNLTWIRLLNNYRNDGLTQIGDSTIINTGCIAGKVGEIRKVLDWSCEKMLASQNYIHEILDQAVINWGVYSKSFLSEIANVHRNGAFVLNMCGIIETKPRYKSGTLFLNESKIPIVHQYDRFGTFDVKDRLTINNLKYVYPTL
jgi:hypothetical protein